MKSLVDEVEQLKHRLSELESQQMSFEHKKMSKLVTARDITVDGAPSLTYEDFQPLHELPNDPESIIILMKWLQHLVDNVGKQYLPDVLSYYVDIDWITDDVRLSILQYSKGIIEDDAKREQHQNKNSYNLPTTDHIRSLLFIQKLKGNSVDDRFMSKIDREMEKLSKIIGTYPLK